MEHYSWIGIVGALASLIWYLVYHHSSNSSSTKIRSVCNPKSEDLEPITSTPPTRALLLFVLRKLNFDYELDQDGDILLKYQGEYLQILASDDRKYILIQDLWWYKFAQSIGLNPETDVNNNSKGSTMVARNYNNEENMGCSWTRIDNLKVNGRDPDIIFVMMGGNDWNSSTPLGSYTTGDTLPEDSSTPEDLDFKPAFALMLSRIKNTY